MRHHSIAKRKHTTARLENTPIKTERIRKKRSSRKTVRSACRCGCPAAEMRSLWPSSTISISGPAPNLTPFVQSGYQKHGCVGGAPGAAFAPRLPFNIERKIQRLVGYILVAAQKPRGHLRLQLFPRVAKVLLSTGHNGTGCR